MGRPTDLAYQRRHNRVHTARGPASAWLCVDCGQQAQEWAQIQSTDGEKPEHYAPRCCSCHQRYDDHWDEKTRAKVSESMRRVWTKNPGRRQFSEQHRARLREAWVRRKARESDNEVR